MATNLQQQEAAQNAAISAGESTVVVSATETTSAPTTSTAPVATGATRSDELILLELQSYRLD